MSKAYDAIVVGGGMLGSAIGLGLAKSGLKTVLLDEGDSAFRAALGNFGLVWVQSKGAGFPSYADWTMRSSDLWAGFAKDLTEETGINLSYSRPGGVHLCLSEEEFEARAEQTATLSGHQNGRFTHKMLDRHELTDMLPGLGEQVVGGSYSPHDGHVSPLFLMRAMQQTYLKLGGVIEKGQRVVDIQKQGQGVLVQAEQSGFTGERLVLAAGLGNRELAPMIGLEQPVTPIKGQVMVTERLPARFTLPMTQIRQTGEGTIMIGDSHEDVGFDTRSTPEVMRTIADRARRSFPFLEQVGLVRSWAALRVMTPDGFPIYDQSETVPGAFTASCHSGVTLAAAHSIDFARDVVEGRLSPQLTPMGARRFHV